MNNKKLVYIPKNSCTINNNCIIFPNGTMVTGTEAYVFTSEELKQLLEDYTDKIIENVAVTSTYIDEVYDSNFEDTALPNEMIFLRTSNDGTPYAANKVTSDKNSMKNQFTKFLKQLEDK